MTLEKTDAGATFQTALVKALFGPEVLATGAANAISQLMGSIGEELSLRYESEKKSVELATIQMTVEVMPFGEPNISVELLHFTLDENFHSVTTNCASTNWK